MGDDMNQDMKDLIGIMRNCIIAIMEVECPPVKYWGRCKGQPNTKCHKCFERWLKGIEDRAKGGDNSK